MSSLRTGEVARQAGVSLETIRYYEQRGLLLAPPRSDAGYRCYPPDAVRRVRFVKRAQELGFSLQEIKELLGLRFRPNATCEDIRRRTRQKISAIDEKIRDLHSIRQALEQLADSCPGKGPVSGCPILDSLDGNSR